MNVTAYTLLNKRGDRAYGLVHQLIESGGERKTRCGKHLDRHPSNWEETEKPVNCGLCLKTQKR